MSGNRILPEGLVFRHPAVLVATWFGTGLLPKAPGTWGSLAALPFAWAIQKGGGTTALAIAAAGLFVIGVWASAVYVRHAGGGDPAAVVVDEVVGQWLVLLAASPDLIHYAAGFVLFRVADILKPWPVSWADREVEGGTGVMLDDVLAAVYAGAALYLAVQWLEP